MNGPASQNLILQGDALENSIILAYEPKNKEAAELEIRARLVAADGAIGEIPVVRWFTETSHGDAVWREPQPTFPIVSGTPVLSYSLPARGMTWRTAARQWRIGFRNQSMITGAPLLLSTVQVTVLPVWGAWVDRYPYTHLALPVAGVVQPYPLTAREWRLRDAFGLPLALGAASIIQNGLLGALFGPTDGALFSDFSPIPHDAAGWAADVPVYAEYQ